VADDVLGEIMSAAPAREFTRRQWARVNALKVVCERSIRSYFVKRTIVSTLVVPLSGAELSRSMLK
jgi:hypothetical protein